MFGKYQPIYFAGVVAGIGLGLVLGEYTHTGKLFGGAAPLELTILAYVLIAVGATLGQRWSRVGSE